MKFRKIEVIESFSNTKGDLFTRLIADWCHTLGYDEPRLNVHKAGREIDVSAVHRFEQKIALVECKAQEQKIGGNDISKFVGILDAERRKIKKEKKYKGHSVVGYFISLSGFTETAIEQEKDFNGERVILVKPELIVDQLIRGKVLVSLDKALQSIKIPDGLTIVQEADIIASERGWIWVIYLSNSAGQNITHFSFVHAEGQPLVNSIAEEIIHSDTNGRSVFKNLRFVSQQNVAPSREAQIASAEEKYFKYLQNELGEIQFEGLPTDKEAGAVKVRLENIFVPLHLSTLNDQAKAANEVYVEERLEIGKILAMQSRLAILAKPGGGKSTLIKRIAIAYAFPARRNEINDSLPDKPWFPIFFRCRELGEKVNDSITEIIRQIPYRAEIGHCAVDFDVLVSQKLQDGTALLLIDGLDEIAEDKFRISFVNQLRTFIATYPTINIIVTSREAGFRAVGGSLATYCKHFTVSNLTNGEIRELCIKWHKAIIDTSENTVKEAVRLSDTIVLDDRIRVLAQNPLLLTTLLFVKRWAGYLPTKRSILYQEMIKLLLVTWNVEGHEQLDIEEAEPQLAFVAYWMSINGNQTINEEDLKTCLIDARKQMPEILGYTNISPSEFIKRVESRSSLLIMSGHKRLPSGQLVQIYEFLHLSFQEYLTAKAIVKRYLPRDISERKSVDIIKPHINKENWKEVVPLIGVLLERDSKDIIEHLVAECKKIASTKTRDREHLPPTLLGSCLANEVQITPEVLGTAIEWFTKNTYNVTDKSLIGIILKNKFGNAFRKRVDELFFDSYEDKDATSVGSAVATIFLHDLGVEEYQHIIQAIAINLQSKSIKDNCKAVLGLMAVNFEVALDSRRKVKKEKKGEVESVRAPEPLVPEMKPVFSALLTLLKDENSHLDLSIFWCLAWSAEAKLVPSDLKNQFSYFAIRTWLQDKQANIHRVASWALTRLLSPDTNGTELGPFDGLNNFIVRRFEEPRNEFDKITAVYLAYILSLDLDAAKLQEFFNSELMERPNENYIISLQEFASAYKIVPNSRSTDLTDEDLSKDQGL